MALVPCPNCRSEVHESAPNCFACGAGMKPGVAAVRMPDAPVNSYTPTVQTHARSPLACPRCAAEDTRRVALIYAEGTSVSAGGSVGFVAGELAVLPNAGRNQSALAQMLAPPGRESLSGYAIAALMAGIVVGTLVGTVAPPATAIVAALIVMFVVYPLMSRTARHWNDVELPVALSNWNQKMLCRRCGHVFVPSAAPSPPQQGE